MSDRALACAHPPSDEARAAVDALRVELIGEAADLMLPFALGAREAARAGDLDRLGACLRALRLSVVTMLKAYGQLVERKADP